MTVETETSRSGPYAGAGTTGPFTVSFRFLADSHLQVIKTDSDDVDTTLDLTTDYTVSGAGNPTGTVTLVVALAVGEQLTIIRDVPFTQEADYVDNDSFPAESHEQALDLLTMQTQQVKEVVGRSLTLPATVSGVSAELPAPVANNIIGWDSAGTALENVPVSSLATSIIGNTYTVQTFDGDGVTVDFTLSSNPGGTNPVFCHVGGVEQTPGLDFSVSGLTATFLTGAPPAGTDNVVFKYGTAVTTIGEASSVTGQTVTGTALITAANAAAARSAINAQEAGSYAASGGNTDITSSILTPGYLFGCTLSTAGSSATFTVAAGKAQDSTGLRLMVLASAISKTTAAWAVGTGNGGLDTGAIANGTWYHAHLIERTDFTVRDVLVSLSPTAPTMPAGYTYARRLGSMLTNGSAQWVLFVQYGDTFLWDADAANVNGNAPIVATLVTTTVPTGVIVEGIYTIGGNPAANLLLRASCPATSDQAPTQAGANYLGSGTFNQQSEVRVFTNTSAQIRIRGSSANNYILVTKGFIDRRGRDA